MRFPTVSAGRQRTTATTTSLVLLVRGGHAEPEPIRQFPSARPNARELWAGIVGRPVRVADADQPLDRLAVEAFGETDELAPARRYSMRPLTRVAMPAES
jgi:hypothetical protein